MEITGIRASKAYFDTNLFIYLIEGHSTYKERIVGLIHHLEGIGCRIVTSELTLAEYLVKPCADGDRRSEMRYLESIRTSPFLEVLPVSREILVKAARLRAELKNKLPDSIHLASAMLHGCDVFIGNDRSIRSSSALPIVLLD